MEMTINQKTLKMLEAKAVYDTINAKQGAATIYDADTILADIVEQVDMHVPMIFEDIYDIWMDSTDKKSVEALFYELTDVDFFDFIERTIKESYVKE